VPSTKSREPWEKALSPVEPEAYEGLYVTWSLDERARGVKGRGKEEKKEVTTKFGKWAF